MLGDLHQMLQGEKGACRHQRDKLHCAGNSFCVHGGEFMTGSLDLHCDSVTPECKQKLQQDEAVPCLT